MSQFDIIENLPLDILYYFISTITVDTFVPLIQSWRRVWNLVKEYKSLLQCIKENSKSLRVIANFEDDSRTITLGFCFDSKFSGTAIEYKDSKICSKINYFKGIIDSRINYNNSSGAIECIFYHKGLLKSVESFKGPNYRLIVYYNNSVEIQTMNGDINAYQILRERSKFSMIETSSSLEVIYSYVQPEGTYKIVRTFIRGELFEIKRYIDDLQDGVQEYYANGNVFCTLIYKKGLVL